MNIRTALAALLLAVATPAAVAGEAGCGDCQNCCPLAKRANQHRATGSEAVLASRIVQKDEIARVVRNLPRI